MHTRRKSSRLCAFSHPTQHLFPLAENNWSRRGVVKVNKSRLPPNEIQFLSLLFLALHREDLGKLAFAALLMGFLYRIIRHVGIFEDVCVPLYCIRRNSVAQSYFTLFVMAVWSSPFFTRQNEISLTMLKGFNIFKQETRNLNINIRCSLGNHK
jgi:hypothetical protein